MAVAVLQKTVNSQVTEPKDKWRCLMKSISIRGESNVNQFLFHYTVPYSDSIPSKYGTPICKTDTDLVIYKIPVLAFEGENTLMLKDFQKLLKASQYPVIQVQINKEVFREIVMKGFPALNMELTLAGVSRKIESNYIIKNRNQNKIYIEGNFYTRFTDYNLDPPQKIFGMVQVRNFLYIQFEIILFKYKASKK